MWPMKKLGFGSTGSLRKPEKAYEAKNKRGVLFPEGPRIPEVQTSHQQPDESETADVSLRGAGQKLPKPPEFCVADQVRPFPSVHTDVRFSHPLAIRSGSVPALSNSVITHSGDQTLCGNPDRVGSAERGRRGKKEKEGESCDCSKENKTVGPALLSDNSSWGRLLPLLELLGRDQAGSGIGLFLVFGLPPGGIVLAHDLKDGTPLEGQSGLLAWDGFVLLGFVVKERLHKHLDVQRKTKSWIEGTAGKSNASLRPPTLPSTSPLAEFRPTAELTRGLW
ncbi:hypothetical protein EYF80_017363 [Liparis tanakae]|uniref:Uncharacterized protein n=1 Tax=Liparis tanakae TaxID=230148 RepID=A0A4Z2I377_9TELE|nr:hypothetical protein EYF80_017363 [Liparis tanakae]